ncbi:MAG: tRNA (guanosine(46)-N7)-methyltransferase TrmB [Bdellovibrionaceae bacterium]|nr:tRNA (guanosine(46)-N7)-methyltransferase TrmB [Pseudobdellovibrionaceae bacterium]
MSFKKFGTSHSMELSLEDSKLAHPYINSSFINPYIQKMIEYGGWVLPEDKAKLSGGKWAAQVFKNDQPVHVEIGTGNGFHFAHYAQKNPQFSLVGFEIKYKTLIQSIARARGHDCTNARMVLGSVKDLTEYFGEGEVEKLIIHFPDPWPKRRHQKNRLVNAAFLNSAYKVLKPGGIIEFKTDHEGYFHFAASQIRQSPLSILAYTEDLHRSIWASTNFKTQFESLFLRYNQPIYYFSLKKQ